MKLKYLLSFFLFFSYCSTLEEGLNKKTESKKQFKTYNSKMSLRKQSNIKRKNSTKPKPAGAISKQRLLAKKDALPKDYHRAKKSKTELEQDFETHLENLIQTCEQTENKKEFLKTQLVSFDSFLKTSLKDPNMDYILQLLFSDITSALEEANSAHSINLDTFSRFYRMLYNLPENIAVKDYPDNWAKIIAQSIECALQ